MFAWFDNLRIGTKLLAVLGVVLAFTVLVGAVAVVQLNSVSSQGQALASNALPHVRLVSALRSTVLEIRILQYQRMLSDSEDEQKAMNARIQALAGKLAEARKAYEPLMPPPMRRPPTTSSAAFWPIT